MTLRETVVHFQGQLAAVPDLAPTAAQDAALLVLGTLDLSRTLLYTHPTRLLSERDQAKLTAALHRRLLGEPMQYILGTQQFFGLPFAVSPAVLIPRPETEILVEAVIHRLPADRPLHIADVGTGSGAIAVALATHLPLAHFTAIDLSPAALAVARANAGTHDVARRITFLRGDLLTALPPATNAFDAIVSNPPYVPRSDQPTLHRQVREFEPHLALFPEGEIVEVAARDEGGCATGRDDGLATYRRLLPQALALLAAGGLLALEVGAGQRAALAVLLQGWSAVEFLPDLQGIPRVALARRHASYSPK